MKHFVMLLLFSLSFYFVWSYAAKRDKRTFKRFTKRHVAGVGIILALITGALFVMFYNRAINIL